MDTELPSHNRPVIIDVDEQTFEQAVLKRSHEVPVVVDFWAPWCGPCRTLGPMLERLARESQGTFILAKINVDHNQRLASAYHVQGIPAVKAFRDGRVIDEFTGALPESHIRSWLRRLTPPAQDRLAEQATVLEVSDPEAAEALYRQVLASQADHPASLFGLGRLLIAKGDQSGATLLRQIPAGTAVYPQAQAWLTLSDFLSEANETHPDLAQQVADDPDDLEARYQLAAYHMQAGQSHEAMAHLLAIIEHNRSFREDAARRTLLAIFEALGDQHPLVTEYRKKLANALF